MTLPNLSALPDIRFADGDAGQIESYVIGAYERLSGVTLQPADPVRLFLESLAYVITVQNNVLDLAGKQNLLAFATGGHLDHLGALMGVSRIPAQPARCALRFTVGEQLGFPLPIPAGTRVSTQDGKIAFQTTLAAEIPAGALAVDVAAKATEAGEAASGLVAGQVCRLVDPLPYIVSAANIDTTAEGSNVEDDARLRERIRLAPESYTVAGSAGQYEARVLEVSADILAVSVYSPEPGMVDVRFVLQGGELPDAAMVALVRDHLTSLNAFLVIRAALGLPPGDLLRRIENPLTVLREYNETGENPEERTHDHGAHMGVKYDPNMSKSSIFTMTNFG